MRQPRLPKLDIIHEDADVIVINKPHGLLTSTVPTEKRATAIATLREMMTDPRARVGVIHRLDRDATGLLVFSKSHDAYRALKEQFFKHTVKRVYAAIVHGTPNPREGTIKTRLVEIPDGSVHTTRRSDAGEEAITHYKTIRIAEDVSLLRVTLETGKKHQIRVHLSERGFPIVNDPVYGTPKRDGQMMLAAIELQFDHPRSGKRMRFEIPLPRIMAARIDGR
jgi:23S rRNA pseudouridine1911/1915/1917 synthase